MKSNNTMKRIGVSTLAVGMLIIIMLSSNSPMIFAVLPEGGGGGSSKSYAIHGYVRDDSGMGISGASVSITGTTSGYTTTSSSGYYYKTLTKYNGPSTGSFTVSASKSGYSTSSTSVSVPAGSSRSVGDLTIHKLVYTVTITADQIFLQNDDEPDYLGSNPAEAYMKTPSGDEIRLGNYYTCASRYCFPLYDISSYGVTFTTTVSSLSGSYYFELRDKVEEAWDFNGDTALWKGYISIESVGTSTGWSTNGIDTIDIGVASIVTTYTLYTSYDPCYPTSCGVSNFYNEVQFTVQITAT